jgi:integrase
LLQFLLLTAARRGEATEMVWAELDGTDWVLPAVRNKVKADLVRPLSSAALTVLAKLPRFAGCDLVFTTDGRRAISGFDHFKKHFDAACSVTNWRLHDLRRTSRSLMSRAGVNADIAERMLGHTIGGVRKTYDRHEYHSEKKIGFEKLARQIELIINPQFNISQLRGAGRR